MDIFSSHSPRKALFSQHSFYSRENSNMLEELQERAVIILERCQDLNITISPKELELGKENTFAGHIISQAGIRPDDSKYIAATSLSGKTLF